MRLNRLYYALAFVLTIATTQLGHSAQYIPDSSISPNITRNNSIVPTGEVNAICVSNTPGPTPAIVLCSTVDLTSKTILYKIPEYTVANLPASHPLAIATNAADSTTCTTGGGSTKNVCWWNGSTWISLSGGGGSGDVTDVLGTNNEICVSNSGGPQPQASLCATVVLDGKTLRVGRFEISGDYTPAAITGNTDDWSPTNLSAAGTLRISSSAVWELRGLNTSGDGRLISLYNVGSFAIVFKNEATTSTAATRFLFGSDVTVLPNQGILIQYDATASRWRNLGAGGGGTTSGLNYCADQGSSDAYACNLSPAITTYTTGQHYFFKANTANTGQATLAFNGIASPPFIKKQVGGSNIDLDSNDIRVGQIVEVVYDGTNFQMLSQLGNAPTGVSGGTAGTLPRYLSSTQLENSGILEDATNTRIAKPIIQGDCTTNCARQSFSAVTGVKTFDWPNHAGTVPISPNARKAVSVALFDPATDVTSGNGKFYLRVPSTLNGMALVAIKSNTNTAGTTNATSVQITRCAAVTGAGNICSGTTASMLTTAVSVDSGENDSDGAATPPAINASNATVTVNQVLRFDVTAVSTTAPKGLGVLLEFELP